jgi:1-hydroxycarotenoid 3,4-desaturase
MAPHAPPVGAVDVVVVGAGIAGLAAAIDLARQGYAVEVLEAAPTVGGKMRRIAGVDAGPTVLTMRHVFDELFARAGADFAAEVSLRTAHVLARHGFWDGTTLDLFADARETADAIGALCGPREAQGYLRFVAYARDLHALVEGPFMRAHRPTVASMMAMAGRIGLGSLMKVDAHRTLWSALGGFFEDLRLRNLFARYATYSGSSPFEAPATLNVIAHVEREGVYYVEGGMHALAVACARLAERVGARVRCGAPVDRVLVERGRAVGVALASGEELRARVAVVHAGDVGALEAGRLGEGAKRAARAPRPRSASAVVFTGHARLEGFPYVRHNVFLARDYAREFEALFHARALPPDPVVYVCAQAREDAAEAASEREPVLVLVQAPANGDAAAWTSKEIDACRRLATTTLSRSGARVTLEDLTATTPADFERAFPGSGGALYGGATHGKMAPLERPGATSAIPGLFLAGGTVHPGAGVPMAATSGVLAAEAIATASPSTRR